MLSLLPPPCPNGDGPDTDNVLPPKGVLAGNGVEEGAVPKSDGAAAVVDPNGDGPGAATSPKADEIGADDPNADVAVDEMALKVDPRAVGAPNGDGLGAVDIPNGEGLGAGKDPNGDGAAAVDAPKPELVALVAAVIKPDDSPPPSDWLGLDDPDTAHGLDVGAAAGVILNDDDCPTNGDGLGAIADEPKNPPPKGFTNGSPDILLSADAGDGLGDKANAVPGELSLSPQLDDEENDADKARECECVA